MESREIEASSIRVTELVQVYARFLRDAQRAPINTLAEFMALAARLLLGKVQAIFPVPLVDEDETDTSDPEDLDEEDLMFMLRRYRPYREAARHLADLQARRERHFTRPAEEGPATFDLGDLYSLSYFWWKLLQRQSAGAMKEEDARDWDEYFYEEVPDVIPDEIQVDSKMEEIRQILAGGKTLDLQDLIPQGSGRTVLIVTLLALLELSRLREIDLVQKEVLGHVQISIASSVVTA